MERLGISVISWNVPFEPHALRNHLKSRGVCIECHFAPKARKLFDPERINFLMKDAAIPEDPSVLLSIENNRNPEQVIYLVIDDSREHLHTQGLQRFFGLKEIRLDTQDVVESIHEYAAVLSYILDTISTARDLNLPYRYENEFKVGDTGYTLYEEGEYRSLRKVAA
jgi:hypothetical protein